MWKIAITKGDSRLFLEEEYSTMGEALKASLSIEILEVLLHFDYDLCTIVEV